LYADALRGHDSTGVFTVDRQLSTVDVYKRAMTAYDYLGMSYYKTRFSSKFLDSPFIVGHNRKATKGGIHNSTAHPFISDNIVMVHNGTLINHKSLPSGEDFVVDSEALANAMSKIGAKEAFEKAVGAFAVVWYDTDEQKVSMVRNTERPLHYANCKEHDSVLIASEPVMLMWIAFRNKIQIDKIIPLKEGEITTFDKDDLYNPTKTTIKLATRPVIYNNYYKGKTTNNANAQLYGKATIKHNPVVAFDKNARRKSKHDRKVDQRLTSYGLSLGGTVLFESISIGKYKGSSEGKVVKLLGIYGDDKKSVLILDYSFNVDNYRENAAYSASIVGMDIGKTGKDDVVIVNGSKTIKPQESKKEDDKRTVYTTTTSSNISPPPEKLRGPKGDLISRAEWDKLTEDGCANCSGVISKIYHERVVFLSLGNGGGVLCHECGEDWVNGRIGPIH